MKEPQSRGVDFSLRDAMRKHPVKGVAIMTMTQKGKKDQDTLVHQEKEGDLVIELSLIRKPRKQEPGKSTTSEEKEDANKKGGNSWKETRKTSKSQQAKKSDGKMTHLPEGWLGL